MKISFKNDKMKCVCGCSRPSLHSHSKENNANASPAPGIFLNLHIDAGIRKQLQRCLDVDETRMMKSNKAPSLALWHTVTFTLANANTKIVPD
jgi:hypothetical protein